MLVSPSCFTLVGMGTLDITWFGRKKRPASTTFPHLLSFHLTQHVNAITENRSTWWSRMAFRSDDQNSDASGSESEVHLLRGIRSETSTKRADRHSPAWRTQAAGTPAPSQILQYHVFTPSASSSRATMRASCALPRLAASQHLSAFSWEDSWRAAPAAGGVWCVRGPGARAARACASGRACLRRRRAEDALGAAGELALARGGGGT
jgi:hypothetical protein